jgi:hypothetical protein
MACNPGDVVRATFKLDSSGGFDIQNVYYFKHVGSVAVDDVDVHTDLTSFLLDAYANIKPDMPSTVAFTSIAYFNVTQDYPIAEVSTSGYGTGDGGATSLPLQVSALVTFPIGTVAKSLGKKYLGPLVPGVLSGAGIPSSTFLGHLTSFIADVLSACLVDGEQFEIGHIRETAPTWVPWVIGVAELLFSTQRKRKQGIGS